MIKNILRDVFILSNTKWETGVTRFKTKGVDNPQFNISLGLWNKILSFINFFSANLRPRNKRPKE